MTYGISAIGLAESIGVENKGGFVQPYDAFNDFVIQGYLTPAGGSLTGIMSTAAFPGGTNVAIAFTNGHRVYNYLGDPNLSYTYPASMDTYDDIDYNGVIYHSSVANGAGAPSVVSNSLRLQKVVTNGSAITVVTQLAGILPTLKGAVAATSNSPDPFLLMGA